MFVFIYNPREEKMLYLMIQERKKVMRKLCVYMREIRGVYIVKGKGNLGFEMFSEVLC